MIFTKKRILFLMLIGLFPLHNAHAVRFPDQFYQIVSKLYYTKVLTDHKPGAIAEAATVEEYMSILSKYDLMDLILPPNLSIGKKNSKKSKISNLPFTAFDRLLL
jgi:hypothetical protein